MPSHTLRVVARVVALPNQVDAVKSILDSIVLPTRQEQGCLKYELVQNNDDPTDFTFIEEWESQNLLEKHLASSHIQSASLELKDLVVGSPDIRCYSLIA
ncbi:MAG: putative quinol monooxygenase [Trichodesmium sp.]